MDFAQLIKIYGPEVAGPGRYSPPEVIGTTYNAIIGQPDPAHVSTSFVERQNLTMRIGMRRFTRLTNGFSKKIQNHEATVAIHYIHYNFCRIHQTTRLAPAMAAGICDHVWELEEIANLVEEREIASIAAGTMKRGKYRKVRADTL